MCLVVGNGSRPVSIVGGAVSDIQLTPTDADATYTLNAAGTEVSSPAAISNTWLITGAASDYEVRATVNSGGVQAGTTGSWLGLGSDRAWSCTRSLNSAGSSDANLTIEIRSATTLAVLDSAVVTLHAEVEI